MNNVATFLDLVIIGVIFSVSPMVAFAYTGQELAPGAKVSIGQARAIGSWQSTDQELVADDALCPTGHLWFPRL
jgi:hypothetical protein